MASSGAGALPVIVPVVVPCIMALNDLVEVSTGKITPLEWIKRWPQYPTVAAVITTSSIEAAITAMKASHHKIPDTMNSEYPPIRQGPHLPNPDLEESWMDYGPCGWRD